MVWHGVSVRALRFGVFEMLIFLLKASGVFRSRSGICFVFKCCGIFGILGVPTQTTLV